MRGERSRAIFLMALVLVVLCFIVVNQNFSIDFKSLTGFAVFNQYGNEFDNGTYNNTLYNGSHILLSGNNLSGTYTSSVLDATDDATWNNLSFLGSEPEVWGLWVVDGSGDVYSSSNLINWTKQTTDYGRNSDTQDMVIDSDYYYIFSNSNREVWRSSTGTSWSVVNDTFADSNILTAEIDSSGNIYVADGSGDVYESSDQGATWIKKGDFNNGNSNNAKGMAINSSGAIFIIDGNKDLYLSLNSGTNWTKITHDYTGAGGALDDLEVDSSGDLYILDDKDIWKSTNEGNNWTKINDSFTSYSNDGFVMNLGDNDYLYISDGLGRIWNSTNLGINWNEMADFDMGSSANPKGLEDSVQSTSLSFQYRNCSLANCSDGSWTSGDITDIALSSRYFQYKITFVTPSVGVSPVVRNVTVDYDLNNQAPTLDLISPENTLYTSNSSLSLNYTIGDSDGNLDSCWYTLDFGTTNITISNCTNTTFNVNEGSYVLFIYANDTLGPLVTDSVSFDVDVTGVSVNLTEPTGTKTSRTGISLNFSKTGNNLNCWYNIKTSIGGLIIGNTTLTSCLETIFNVSSDGDYIANLFANNTFGTFASDSSSFSVSTSSSGVTEGNEGSSSSGGGGGSSAGGGTITTRLDVEEINVIMALGEEKRLLAKVKNVGIVAANKCKLEVDEENKEAIESDDITNIAAGEIVEFGFVLKALDEETQNAEINIVCLEGVSKKVPLNIKFVKSKLGVSIEKMDFIEGPSILVNYSIQSFTPSTEKIIFKLLDENENSLLEKEEEVKLVKGDNDYATVLNLEDVPEGMIKISVEDKDNLVLVQETVIYDGSTSFTGRAISGGSTASYIGITIIFFLVVGLIIFRRIWKLKKGHSR